MLLVALLLFVPALAEESVEVILFDGQASVPGAWTLITGVNTTNASGDFDPYLITEGGVFRR